MHTVRPNSRTAYDFRYASAGRLCVNDRNRFYTNLLYINLN